MEYFHENEKNAYPSDVVNMDEGRIYDIHVIKWVRREKKLWVVYVHEYAFKYVKRLQTISAKELWQTVRYFFSFCIVLSLVV